MSSTSVIYEVNIALPKTTFVEQEAWLYEHFQGMLREPGFLRADVFDEQDAQESEARLTIHYLVRDQGALDAYLARAATAMRSSANERLGPGYRVHRRVLRGVSSLESLERVADC